MQKTTSATHTMPNANARNLLNASLQANRLLIIYLFACQHATRNGTRGDTSQWFGIQTVNGEIRMADSRQAGEAVYTKKQVFVALSSCFLVYLVYSYYIQAPRMAADLDGMHLYSWSVSIPGLGLAFGTILVGNEGTMGKPC
jgi:hypothetical protein